jgi:hypothetical protein
LTHLCQHRRAQQRFKGLTQFLRAPENRRTQENITQDGKPDGTLVFAGGNESGEEHKRGLTADLLAAFHAPTSSLGEGIVTRYAQLMHEVQDLIFLETQELSQHPLWQRTKGPFWCSEAAVVVRPTFTKWRSPVSNHGHLPAGFVVSPLTQLVCFKSLPRTFSPGG